MITGLDHVAVAVRDFDAAVDGYRRLLGREPHIDPRDGAIRAWFRMPNAALEVIAPRGAGGAGDRLRARLDEAGEGLWLAAFAVADLAEASRLLGRRGLEVEPLGGFARVRTAGLTFVIIEGGAQPLSPAIGPEHATVAGLDHFVIHTPDPERAVATYAGRMGLDLRLDRDNPRFGLRQLWFRCGDVVAEVACRLGAPASEGPDSFGGFAWRVTDPDAAHARMAAAGLDLSEVRKGRKPGTRVFTVRDAPAGVPTLMIQQNAEVVSA